MKTLIWYWAAAIGVGMAATVSGQSEIPNDSSTSSSYIPFSKLVGRKVKSSGGKEIGVIKDVVIDRSNGSIAYTVLSAGGEGTGVIGAGGKLVAVPWAVYSPTSDLSVLKMNVDWDKIHNAPPFDYARMDEYARPDYINNVYSYYGVSPGPRTTATGFSGATVATDVTGTAGPTASPGEVASPAPIATVPPNKAVSARTNPASAVSPDTDSSGNHSRKRTRSARAIDARPLIDRGETASSTTIEESVSETTTSPSEYKKSRRKAVEDTSTHRQNATPEAADGED